MISVVSYSQNDNRDKEQENIQSTIRSSSNQYFEDYNYTGNLTDFEVGYMISHNLKSNTKEGYMLFRKKTMTNVLTIYLHYQDLCTAIDCVNKIVETCLSTKPLIEKELFYSVDNQFQIGARFDIKKKVWISFIRDKNIHFLSENNTVGLKGWLLTMKSTKENIEKEIQ